MTWHKGPLGSSCFFLGQFWVLIPAQVDRVYMDQVGVKSPLEGRSAVWDSQILLGKPQSFEVFRFLKFANTAQISVAQFIYIYIYASPPPRSNILTPLAGVHVSRALFPMLTWRSYRNSEDKLSLQVACTMLPNQLFVFHWANLSKLFCICTNLSLPNLLFLSVKFGL